MKFKQLLLCLIIILITGLLYYFRSVPTGQLWDNYTVVYVPENSDDSVIANVFNENGIKEFISLDGQENPACIEKNSMAELMFKMNLSNTDNEYLERRLNYFFDSEKNYRIYYVPDRHKDKIEKTVKALDKAGIYAGVDSSVAYPWMLPIIVTVASLIVMFCVKHKMLFFFGMIAPVYFVYCMPFYSVASSVVIEMIILVFISNLWAKDGGFKRILKNPFTWMVLVISVTSSFATSLIAGLLFISSLIAQVCLIFIWRLQEKKLQSKQTYVFLNIKPLKMIPIYAKKAHVVLPVMILSVAGIYGSYKFYATSNITSHFSQILLPGVAEEHDNQFPLLEEYYKWNWKIISFPYKSLNLEYDNDILEISMPRYEKDGNEIKQTYEVFAYDNKYKKMMNDFIDDLSFNNVEHIIKSQGSDFKCGYTTAKNYQVSNFSIIMIFICFSILIIIYISAIIKKDGRK